MEREQNGQHVLEQQQQLQRQQQVANPAGSLVVVASQVDHDFFTRVWEAQGHAFAD